MDNTLEKKIINDLEVLRLNKDIAKLETLKPQNEDIKERIELLKKLRESVIKQHTYIHNYKQGDKYGN